MDSGIWWWHALLLMMCIVARRCCVAFNADAIAGQRINRQGLPLSAAPIPLTDSPTRTLGLLTFDLDDTLFPTSQVVYDANVKMVAFLNEQGYATTLAGFLNTTRTIRNSLGDPITYTGLRKMAIASEMQNAVNHGVEADAALVEQAYQVWEKERHAAAERYLFPEVIPTLQAVQTAYPDACIAAVTNGKGNPLYMQDTIAEYFDFCVSGEDDNVFPNRKPHAGIYQVSSELYRARYEHHSSGEDERYIWCHVGDCLANDVGASAARGAFAVWYAPDNVVDDSVAVDAVSDLPSYSTASQEDVAKRLKQSEAARERVAVRIRSLSELTAVIAELVGGASFS
jgi:FMN phosphatase YigB (HAD superfamily)